MTNGLIKSLALVLGGVAAFGGAWAAQSFAYPPADRTAEQQRQDQYECHRWAVEQSHYDPSQAAAQGQASAQTAVPARSPGGAAVGGAARGAAVAKVADDDTNDAAKAGAALGLIRQRRAQAAAAYENAQTQKAAQQQQREVQAKQQAYDSARNTCFKARGYTLSD